MDLNFLYSDFVMDDREVLFHSAPCIVSSFHDDEGNIYCAVPAFQHSDADLARDPLSTNRRLVNIEELPIFGTMVVAGATADHIKVLIPDTFSGPTVNADSGPTTCGGPHCGTRCRPQFVSTSAQPGSGSMQKLSATYFDQKTPVLLGGG